MKILAFLSLFVFVCCAAPACAQNQSAADSPVATPDQRQPLGLAPVKVAPGPVAAKLVVFKAQRQLVVLDQDGKVLHSYKISLGWTPVGPKQEEGDGKTPEGDYTIDHHNDNSAYHKSLHISYPGKDDIVRAREKNVSPGGAIFIHGKPNFKAWMFWKYNHSNDWTNGCIALSNSDMNQLWDMVPDGTPITINP